MAWKGIKHKSVGNELDKTEWESEEGHELANGNKLPETGEKGDLFFKNNESRLYIWVE